jgi:pre-mRNA-splicing factor 18
VIVSRPKPLDFNPPPPVHHYHSMDLLQRELARKKSILAKAHLEKPSKRKYLKHSELQRLEEQQQEREQEERIAVQQQQQQQHHAKRHKKMNDINDAAEENQTTLNDESRHYKNQNDVASNYTLTNTTTTTNNNNTNNNDHDDTDPSSAAAASAAAAAGTIITTTLLMSPETLRSRLRAFGLPICFFGENQTEKQERLKAALAKQDLTLQGLSEMEEFRLGQGFGIRNPFLGKEKQHEKTNALAVESGKEPKRNNDDADEIEGDTDDDDDPAKRIYKFLKGLLREWEEDLEARSKSVALSVAGRNESMTFQQCHDYIRPLFKQLKRRKLEAGMQAHLVKIVEYAKEGEFVKAHDAYMDVAIGRAAWPIGVTMVGIHARSGRAKIESSNVAHVMNSELQRKYLTSVKRLLSYAQKKRPDVDPSKKVA